MSNRDLKDARYTAFAEMGKVFANARRLEIIDVLIQRPRSVEEIATSIQQSVASTSQHLQVLKRTKTVNTERQGTTIIYSLTEGTLEVFVAMRKLADAINPSLQVLQQQRSIPSVTFEHVQHVLQESSAILLDVRTVKNLPMVTSKVPSTFPCWNCKIGLESSIFIKKLSSLVAVPIVYLPMKQPDFSRRKAFRFLAMTMGLASGVF